jgi:hypothetical protein
MKDITRQAVADAAQVLFCEFGYFECVLKDGDQQGLINAAIAERDVASEQKRASQLRQAMEAPVGVLSLIAAKVDDVLIVGPGGFVQRACIQRPALREACADHALKTWLRDGFGEWFFRAAGPGEIMRLKEPMVSVPRAALERLKTLDRTNYEFEAVWKEIAEYL